MCNKYFSWRTIIWKLSGSENDYNVTLCFSATWSQLFWTLVIHWIFLT